MLRVHRWTKNLLIFVPLVTGHQLGHWDLLWKACLSFLSFSFCASGVYLINDIVDLDADRQHSVKRGRPFASGRVSIVTGFVPTFIVMGTGVLTSLLPPRPSLYVLVLYVALALAYCFWLKRILLADVFALAALYTIRLVAGHAAYGVELSTWLLSFSMFLFLSLGFCKRTSELHNMGFQKPEVVQGRAYRAADLVQINLFGVVSGFLSTLVLTLYMQSSGISELYKQPQILWLLFPLLLHWITRLWILAARGKVNEDPVLFAIKDKMTWATGICALMLLFLAGRRWV